MSTNRTSRRRAMSIFSLLSLLISPTLAAPLTCAEDHATNAYFCFNQKELRLEGGIRTAPLYTGGPRGVTKSQYYIAANCESGVIHLKDRQGVSFGGAGPGGGTAQSRQLRRYVCDASLSTPKKK